MAFHQHPLHLHANIINHHCVSSHVSNNTCIHFTILTIATAIMMIMIIIIIIPSSWPTSYDLNTVSYSVNNDSSYSGTMRLKTMISKIPPTPLLATRWSATSRRWDCCFVIQNTRTAQWLAYTPGPVCSKHDQPFHYQVQKVYSPSFLKRNV